MDVEGWGGDIVMAEGVEGCFGKVYRGSGCCRLSWDHGYTVPFAVVIEACCSAGKRAGEAFVLEVCCAWRGRHP